MERKIGEVFEFEGKKFKAEKEIHSCEGCYFENMVSQGFACYTRCESKDIIFVEVKDD